MPTIKQIMDNKSLDLEKGPYVQLAEAIEDTPMLRRRIELSEAVYTRLIDISDGRTCNPLKTTTKS